MDRTKDVPGETKPFGEKKIANQDLIKSMWILAMSDKKNEMTPLLPILLQRMYNYKSNVKFTEKELIQLYQIKLHTLRLVEK